MKQAFLAAYEDSENEEEEGSDSEAISLYAVIEYEELENIPICHQLCSWDCSLEDLLLRTSF